MNPQPTTPAKTPRIWCEEEYESDSDEEEGLDWLDGAKVKVVWFFKGAFAIPPSHLHNFDQVIIRETEHSEPIGITPEAFEVYKAEKKAKWLARGERVREKREEHEKREEQQRIASSVPTAPRPPRRSERIKAKATNTEANVYSSAQTYEM